MANKRQKSIELGLTKQDSGRDARAVLELTTDKGSRGIWSVASVMWVGGGFTTFVIFGDYSVTLMNDKTARGTQGNIDKQFAAVFTTEKVAELTAAALAFYAGKEGISGAAAGVVMVCGACEHAFTAGAATPEQIQNGAVECPRCESTDVLSA